MRVCVCVINARISSKHNQSFPSGLSEQCLMSLTLFCRAAKLRPYRNFPHSHRAYHLFYFVVFFSSPLSHGLQLNCSRCFCCQSSNVTCAETDKNNTHMPAQPPGSCLHHRNCGGHKTTSHGRNEYSLVVTRFCAACLGGGGGMKVP